MTRLMMMVFMMAMPMMVVRIMKVVLIKMSTGMNVSSITSRTSLSKML